MTAPLSHSSPARFQLADANTWPNPWPLYRALRDHDPVQHIVPEDKPDHDYYVLSRHADIWSAARAQEAETFPPAPGVAVNLGQTGADRLAQNPADGDAGPAGAHRVPQVG